MTRRSHLCAASILSLAKGCRQGRAAPSDVSTCGGVLGIQSSGQSVMLVHKDVASRAGARGRYRHSSAETSLAREQHAVVRQCSAAWGAPDVVARAGAPGAASCAGARSQLDPLVLTRLGGPHPDVPFSIRPESVGSRDSTTAHLGVQRGEHDEQRAGGT